MKSTSCIVVGKIRIYCVEQKMLWFVEKEKWLCYVKSTTTCYTGRESLKIKLRKTKTFSWILRGIRQKSIQVRALYIERYMYAKFWYGDNFLCIS